MIIQSGEKITYIKKCVNINYSKLIQFNYVHHACLHGQLIIPPSPRLFFAMQRPGGPFDLPPLNSITFISGEDMWKHTKYCNYNLQY